MRKVFHIGPFPPPVHGMASINVAVSDLLRRNGIKVLKLDLSPRKLDRTLFYHVRKFVWVMKSIISYFFNIFFQQGIVTYISLSGGMGQLYDIWFVLISRFKRVKLLIHHHSFAYLCSKSKITNMLIRIAGPYTIHIVLCQSMKNRLIELYGKDLNVIIASNFIFLPQQLNNEKEKTVQAPIKIGFIGNLSFEKGIMDFLMVAKELTKMGLSIEAHIGGPFENDEVKKFIIDELHNSRFIRYYGPVYDEEKKKFFQRIDILLFPTKYKNEAAPLVIFEAMSHGVPIISTKRGCIDEMLADSGSPALLEDGFVKASLDRIRGWVSKPENYRRCSLRGINIIRIMMDNVNAEREKFVELFL
jgi:glycosyltransferase involved in cell wall biosynthesis